MTPTPDFIPTDVPARIADLAFSYLRPADFHVVPVPDERPDFDQPSAFFPLQVVMAGYGAVLFSAVARPAYPDGTVQDWAEYLARENQLEILALQPGVVGGLACLLVEVRQPSEAGLMRMRTALLEDGGRLLNLSIMAPEAIWASVEPTLQLTLSSFRLAEPRGSSTPLRRGDAAPAAKPAPAVPPAAAPDPSPAAAPDPGQPVAPAALALADDASSLDPGHPVNVRLRDRGVGLAPRILETYRDEKYAVLGAGALAAVCRVPFGWHVLDDGRRTLVFDADGKIQVSLNLRRDDGDARRLLGQILDEARGEQPQVDPQFVDFTPEMPGLVLRNYRDRDDVLVQAFVVKHVRDDGLAHVARVTASPDDMTRAMNLAEIILRSLGLAAVAS